MITVKHYICPRYSGKTTFAENLQMEDPENTLLISHPTASIINTCFRGQHFKRLIFDEFLATYDNSSNKEKFFEFFYGHLLSTLDNNGELILISTADKLRHSSTYALAEMGFTKKTIEEMSNPYINKETIVKELEELQLLYLLPQYTEKACFYENKNLQIKALKLGMPTQQYLTEMKGEFLL